jgi:pimeloyl-ACP methyl ester carboxylesterase|tara:strand:+ start:1413 stop:2285 length:873 start_codon:yes stop_codon:yes gene_type:complete
MKRLIISAIVSIISISLYAGYNVNQETDSVDLNGIKIAYTVAGKEEDPAVLMIMGLMASHKVWGEQIVNSLVDTGYRVVLFDNRDTGESDKLDRLGKPNLYWKFFLSYLGINFSAPYTLSDMAEDGVALLEHLNIQEAHIVGASMGGMIAQMIASNHPSKTKSLVSIMSSTGAPHLSMMSESDEENFSNIEDINVEGAHAYGFYPEAMPRQLTAIFHAGDRSEIVKRISVPTLVQHGENDTLLPIDHGEHTASLIKDSQYVVYKNMGHNLPPEVLPLVIEDMINFFKEQK